MTTPFPSFRNRYRLPVLILLLLFLVPHYSLDAARAQTESLVSLTVAPGLDGYCREGRYLPVHLTLENIGPDLVGQVYVSVPGHNTGEVRYAQNVTLPRQSRKEINLTVFPQGFVTELEAVLHSEEKIIVRTPFRVTCIGGADALYGIVSDNPSGFNRLLDADPPSGTAFIAQIEPAALPIFPQGLQALSALIISDVDTSGLSEEQLRALTGWVASGGHLLVTGGPGWQKTLAGIVDLLPLEPTHTQILPGLDPLSQLVGDEVSLAGEAITTQGILKPRARILAGTDSAPLLLQKPLGGGVVSFLAANPSLNPLDRWDNFPRLVRHLLDRQDTQSPSGRRDGFQSWTNAIEAVSTIPGLAFPSVVLVCGFLLFYILAVGPVNYLILRRWGRNELAWASIPILVIIFSGIAFMVGGQTQGGKAILNRMSVVQSWPDAPSSRFDALIGLFSPSRNTYDIELKGDLLVHPVPDNFGGSTQDWQFIQDPPLHIADNVQLEIGGIRAFTSSGEIPSPSISHTLEYRLDSNAPSLFGDLQIISGPSLADAVLLAPGGSFRLDEVTSGREYSIKLDLQNSMARGSGEETALRSPPNLNFIEELIGGPYYTALDDPQTRARVALLNAFLDPLGQPQAQRGEILLAGWSEAGLPFEINIPGHSPERLDLTLYLIALDVPLKFGDASQITLSPDFFSWMPLAGDLTTVNGPPIGPYDTFIQPGMVFDLQYRLSQTLSFQSIANLAMRLESDQDGLPPPQISLWNFRTGAWQIQPEQGWGIHNIDEPDGLVGEGGEIRARVELELGHPGVFLRSLDFTMIVNRGDF